MLAMCAALGCDKADQVGMRRNGGPTGSRSRSADQLINSTALNNQPDNEHTTTNLITHYAQGREYIPEFAAHFVG